MEKHFKDRNYNANKYEIRNSIGKKLEGKINKCKLKIKEK